MVTSAATCLVSTGCSTSRISFILIRVPSTFTLSIRLPCSQRLALHLAPTPTAAAAHSRAAKMRTSRRPRSAEILSTPPLATSPLRRPMCPCPVRGYRSHLLAPTTPRRLRPRSPLVRLPVPWATDGVTTSERTSPTTPLPKSRRSPKPTEPRRPTRLTCRDPRQLGAPESLTSVRAPRALGPRSIRTQAGRGLWSATRVRRRVTSSPQTEC